MMKTFVTQANVQQTTSRNELPVIRTIQTVLEDHMSEIFYAILYTGMPSVEGAERFGNGKHSMQWSGDLNLHDMALQSFLLTFMLFCFPSKSKRRIKSINEVEYKPRKSVLCLGIYMSKSLEMYHDSHPPFCIT